MSTKRSPSLHTLDDDTDLEGRWLNRGIAERNLSSSANIPSPPSRSQLFGKLPEHLCKPAVIMNKTSVVDMVRDKEHDTKPSAMAVKAQDKGRSMALIRASKKGHEAVARFLIDKGVVVEARDGSGLTALIWALHEGHEAIARLLIDKGADIEALDGSGLTALIWASKNGHKAVARFLIDKGADIEARDSSGSTALIWASHRGYKAIAQLLVDKGADIEARDSSGSTALIWASQEGEENVARLLIDKGADIEARDSSRSTALILASHRGYKGIAQLLIDKGADVEARDSSGSTALIWASQKGYEAIAQLLIDKGADVEARDSSGSTALIWASQKGQANVVRLLIDKGAGIEARDSSGSTALIWASQKDYTAVVQFLIDKGADIEARDGSGLTAFIWALQEGHKAVAWLLINKGADVEARDSSESTALILASQNGHEAIVQLLIDKGADINTRDVTRSTALIWALQEGHEAVARLLIHKGADIEARDDSGATVLIWALQEGYEAIAQLLIDKGADVEARDSSGSTALIWASQKGQANVVRLLIDKGADIEARDSSGSTALIWASQKDYTAVVRILINKGADINARDDSGSTALIWASQKGYRTVVQFLIDKGADIEARDGSGLTAFIWASQKGYGVMAQLLIDKMADVPPRNALGSHHSATVALPPRGQSSASDYEAAPFAKAADVTTEDGSADMEIAPAGGALVKNPTLSMSNPLDGHRDRNLHLETQPFDGANPRPRVCQTSVQPTSENETPSWLARDTRQRFRHISSLGQSEQDPIAYVGEAHSEDQKAPDGDQPADRLLRTPARNSPDCAMETPEDSSGESSIEIESLSVSGVSEDELIWALDPGGGISQFIDAAAHRLLGEYRRATIFPPPNEAAISNRSPPTHGETPRVTNNREPPRQPHQHLPASHRKGKRAKKGQGQDSDDEESQRRQPKKQKVNATTEGKPTPLLACPFWKRDSQTHDRCFKLILSNTSRVKQHLFRKHSPEFYCQRCHTIFPSQETLDQHIQVQVVTCPCREYNLPQITYQQRPQLSTKSKTNLPEADQWFAIWDIIFPGQPRPSSPYIDAELSEDLCRFREFAEADGPDIMAAEMQRSLQMTQIPAGQTTEILRQVISRCITLLFERWPAGRPPLSQPGDAAPSLATAMPSESSPAGSSGIQSSSNSIPVMHRETQTSSVVSLDRSAMMPGNTQQEDPFVAVPSFEAQSAEPSDGFHTQWGDIGQELWGWDQVLVDGTSNAFGMPSEIPDF